MINKIFFDIDETLIHTTTYDPEQECHKFELDGDYFTYYTIVRPCAMSLIQFARDLVGFENVHILTTATRDYAETINELAGWGFNKEDIFTREDIRGHRREFPTAYGGVYHEYDPHIYANKNNVLIDNLPPRSNYNKVVFIGISNLEDTNYLHIRDYYGVDRPHDTFEQDVKNFLANKHSNNA